MSIETHKLIFILFLLIVNEKKHICKQIVTSACNSTEVSQVLVALLLRTKCTSNHNGR